MGSRGRVRAAVVAGAALVAGLLVGAVTSGVGGDAGGSPTYTVVDAQPTGSGVEAVVSVRKGEVPEDVLEDVLREHAYGKVTMVCEGTDLEADGWVLVGTVVDGRSNVVVPYADRAC